MRHTACLHTDPAQSTDTIMSIYTGDYNYTKTSDIIIMDTLKRM